MLTVRSHANAYLLAIYKFKASGVNLLVFVRHKFIVSQKIFEYVKDLPYESTPRKFLSPAVYSVIFMAQRPNIAMLVVRAKFMGILSDSVKC